MKKKKPNSKIILTIFTLLMLIGLILVCYVFYNHFKAQTSNSKQEHVSNQSLKNYANKHHAKTIGDPNAKIKIYAFQDFQCSDCKIFHTLVTEELEQDIDNGNVNITYLNHQVVNIASTKYAHMSNIIAEKNSTIEYMDFIDKAFNNQEVKNPKEIVKETSSISNQNELFNAYDKVKNNKLPNDGKKEFNVDGTPTVFVNGDKLKDYTDIVDKVKEQK